MRSTIYLAALAALIVSGVSAADQANTPAPTPSTEATGGIQWFTRLKNGLAEARRTGRPILYLSAAPSCGGVPGVW